jgi:hypothetical protein
LISLFVYPKNILYMIPTNKIFNISATHVTDPITCKHFNA